MQKRRNGIRRRAAQWRSPSLCYSDVQRLCQSVSALLESYKTLSKKTIEVPFSVTPYTVCNRILRDFVSLRMCVEILSSTCYPLAILSMRSNFEKCTNLFANLAFCYYLCSAIIKQLKRTNYGKTYKRDPRVDRA